MKDLAHRAGEEVDPPFDRFLGKLAVKGSKVHEWTAEQLTVKGSAPNDLHRWLVKLFRDPRDIRVVTTNFDRHLETAAQERLPEIDVFEAPALPLGSDFRGIVHLHGSLARSPKSLVLTDADFGAAYISDGWASRFLQDVFANFIVLFVGYSHSDVVLTYLARSLLGRPLKARFAIAEFDEETDWNALGVTARIYEKGEHHCLNECLRKWVELETEDAMARESRLRILAERGCRLLSEEEESYLFRGLCKGDLCTYFYRYAEDPEWLEWASEKELLKPLEQVPAEQTSSVTQDQISWFLRDLLGERGEVASRLLVRDFVRLHPLLWQAIGRDLWGELDHMLREGTEEPPRGPLLRRWIAILISYKPGTVGTVCDFLIHLQAVIPKSAPEASTTLLLFLLEPVIAPNHSESRAMKVRLRCEADDLAPVWNTLDLEHLATRLLRPLAGLLERSFLLHDVAGEPASWDKLRNAVRDHEEDPLDEEGLYLLLNCLRDVLDWHIRNKPEVAATYLQSWVLSEFDIFRRLAIYGLTHDAILSSDEKLDLLVSHRWLDSHFLRFEVSDLLAVLYPALKKSGRKRFFEEFDRLRNQLLEVPDQAPEDVKSGAHGLFELLDWLKRVDPNCDLVRERLADLRRAYPQFRANEHPGEKIRVSIYWGSGESVKSAEDLVRLQPVDYLALLNEQKAQPREFGESHPVDALLKETEKATQEQPMWGVQLVDWLLENAPAEERLIRRILRGWAAVPLNEPEWRRVLDLLSKEGALLSNLWDVCQVVLSQTRRKPDQPLLPEDLLLTTWRFTEQLWSALPEPKPPGDVRDLVHWAINELPGTLASCAFGILWQLRRQARDSWQGIPESYDGLLKVMLRQGPPQTAPARTALCSYFRFFWLADTEWSKMNLLPLLDWKVANGEIARQAWSGYLYHPFADNEILPDLLPLLRATFSRLEAFEERLVGQFTDLLLALAFDSPTDPWEDGWLREFHRTARLEDRLHFIWSINSALRSMVPEVKARLWNELLQPFLEFRCKEQLPKIESRERNSIVDLVRFLPEQLPDLLPILQELKPPSLDEPRRMQFFSLVHERSEFLDLVEMQTFGELLLYLLGGEGNPGYKCEYIRRAIEAYLTSGQADRELANKLVNRYSEVGCRGGQDLLAQFQG